jgi:murein DD-endopeptidase MepM/ murein hydrolase activator NlpD
MRTSSPGGSVQITGTDLVSTATVSFAGTAKRILVTPTATTASAIEVTVPDGAVSGKVRLVSVGGTQSAFSLQDLNIGPPMTFARASALTITDAATTPVKAYQFGKKMPKLSYVLTGGNESNDLRIDITDDEGEIVASKFRKGVATGSTQSITWDGKGTDGKPAPNGAYRFVVRSVDGTEASVSKSLAKVQRKAKRGKVEDPFAFSIYGYVFPMRGPHTYGDGTGANRGHQGQDVLGKCGTPLLAARGGVVYYNDYQASGAGNYLVINVKGSGRSHVYMHMIEPSPLKVGTKVKTGQRIGTVGTTGRSSACHLHFEIWSAPGWYQGGSFLDPSTPLMRWDKYS